MPGPFDAYWYALGLPLSRAKGWAVDHLPFSLVEAGVWTGLACTLLWLLSGRRVRARLPWLPNLGDRRLRRALLAFGPILLAVMACGQGAFPVSLSPTAWRRPLARRFPGPPLPYPDFQAWVHARETALANGFDSSAYASLSEEEALCLCDRRLDTVLARLRLAPGRQVRRVKSMGPFTTLLGLTYGGPAFHDPVLGELAMVRYRDLPTPRYWRLIGVCHEAAHAKGFTREMDAEILTQLALSTAPDARLRRLGDIMLLRKSGERYHFPAYLRAEILRNRELAKRAEARQPVAMALRRLAEILHLRNQGAKYGDREGKQAWDPGQPFFTTVAGLLASPLFRDLDHG